MQGNTENIMDSIGAMAEMTALYRRNLAKQGVPDEEAVRYTVAFVAAMMGGGQSGQA